MTTDYLLAAAIGYIIAGGEGAAVAIIVAALIHCVYFVRGDL